MIVSRIDGGLGNQMFQYAYGDYLARRHGSDFYLDVNSYREKPQHGYLLDHFAIEASELPDALQRCVPPKYRVDQSGLKGLWDWKALKRLKEKRFGFAPEYLKSVNNRYVVGYWQTEKYFPGQRESLLRQFQLRRPMTDASQRVADKIRSCESAVLHIRRGDYLTNQSAAKIYARLDLGYYTQALEHFAARSNKPIVVFVFSNDIAWCRENLSVPWNVHFVDHNNANTAHEDLAMMSSAKCCVIANSTFSWWAAWLNQREDRRIYAPPMWFQPGTLDGQHIVCPDWHVLPDPEQKTAA